MPLKKHTTTRLLPASAGWYWFRPRQTRKWQPVFVDGPTASGWPASVQWLTHTVDVKNMDGDWGPEINPPGDTP